MLPYKLVFTSKNKYNEQIIHFFDFFDYDIFNVLF